MFKSNADYDAEAYFSSINSMAKRIIMDTATLQAAQSEKWKDMSLTDKYDIISKTLMKPALAEKYPDVSSSQDENCFPKLKITSGQKIVIEEENANRNRAGMSWRDEHSAPFLWESQSQLNLSYIFQESAAATPAEEGEFEESETPTDVGQTSSEVESTISPINDSEKLISSKVKQKAEITKRSHSKKKAAPPIPIQNVEQKEEETDKEVKSEKLALPVTKTIEADDEANNIPKTGFDFLDNW